MQNTDLAAAADAPKGTPIANVGELVSRSLRMYRDLEAVRTSSASIRYLELERRSNRLANALVGMGLARGDRVGVYLPNRIEVVELELACYKAALAKTPINSRLSPAEVAQVLANSGATVVLTTADRAEAFRPLVQGAQPRLLLLDVPATSAQSYESALGRASDAFVPRAVGRDDLAVLHYTSGSSGVLKAAMQTFGNRLAQWREFQMRADGRGQPGDILGLVGPIARVRHAARAGAVVGGDDPPVREVRAAGVPAHDARRGRDQHLPRADDDPHAARGGRRRAARAAGAAPARLRRRADGARAHPRVDGRLRPGAHAGLRRRRDDVGRDHARVAEHVEARARHPHRLASCGRPYCETLVEVVDDAGRVLPAGEIGEIVVSGDDVFAGYWNAPGLTAEVLKNGRYHTGDLARTDEDGFIYIVDRKKDMVISGGFNVYPTEVEAVLYQHPAVGEVCVFWCPTTPGARSSARAWCSSPAATRARRRSTPSAPSGWAASSTRGW